MLQIELSVIQYYSLRGKTSFPIFNIVYRNTYKCFPPLWMFTEQNKPSVVMIQIVGFPHVKTKHNIHLKMVTVYNIPRPLSLVSYF